MRNLKKTLCMVLALVFVLGLCTVGVGAVNGTEFDDQETINYSVAVKAMSGLGVLKGDDNDGDGKTEFRPQDPVTRAEAAKIIAYVNVGDEVEKWPARQVFDDVPADHWAAKYVTYCQYNNIIAGYGNGKFGPSDPVTQAQLAKMLLSCCGYGAKDEFIGEGWDQNVAKVAFQTKVLKGILSTDWDGPATREETALLAYNTLMSVVQVALSKDTNDYEPAYINGVRTLTLAESTWELIPVKGIVLQNKASQDDAKGTKIIITKSENATYGVGDKPVMITEDDEDPSVLGHEVTIMFREEGVVPNLQLVAYYIDDECTEVSGAAANTADYADVICNVYNGVVNDNITAGVTTAAFAFNGYAKNYRVYDFTDGKYILNGDGKLVGYKETDYFIAPLSVDAFTGITSVTTPAMVSVPVKAPEGAKKNDMMTVYKCGNIYTAKACTKEEKVAITQRQLNEVKNLAGVVVGWYFTYNDGAIAPSDATNMPGIGGGITLTAINGLPITAEYAAEPAQDAELKVGYSYTLYFDAEGGCYAHDEGIETSAAAIPEYVMFVANVDLETGYQVAGVAQTSPAVQVIKADGTVANIPVVNHTNTATYVPGDVCTVKTDYVNAGKQIVTKVTTVPAKEGDVGAVTRTGYLPKDPTFDFSGAKYIYYTGTGATLAVTAGVMAGTPATRAENPASDISYTCRLVKVGTTLVTKVETVWFNAKAAAVVTYNADSYIYVINDDVKETKIINDAPVNFWNGYKNGEQMDDLRLGSGKTGATGFYKYSVTAGVYTLTKIPVGDGVTTGTRTIYLVDKDTDNVILNNKLYVPDKNGAKQAIDLTDVTVVRISNANDVQATKSVVIDSIAAIQSVLLSTEGYRVQIDFVEYIDEAGDHSVGGGVIYVTSVGYKPAAA